MNKKFLTLILLIFLIFLAVSLYLTFKFALSKNVFMGIFTSAEALRTYILSFDVWAPLVFFWTQVIQVIISPIPGNITALVGGMLFGWLKGFLLNGAGVLVGSIIAFYLARIFGKPLVVKLVGQSVYDKYGKIFSGRYFIGLFLIFLFPFFPDDAICFLAGLSSLPFPLFLVLVLLGRMPGMLVAALTGAGIFVMSIAGWIIVAVVSLGLIYIVLRYREQLEVWLYRIIGLKAEDRL